jgi:hypothetical protein
MENYNWTILQENETDFILGWDDFDINNLPSIPRKDRIEFNQNEYAWEFGYCLCNLYGPIANISNNISFRPDKDQRYDLCKRRVAKPDFQPKVWGYGCVWIDIVRNYAKLRWHDVISYIVNTKSQLFWDLLKKWYTLTIWITVWETFLTDAQDNGILNQTSFWKAKFWHFNSTIEQINWKFYIQDNYKWVLKYNIYEVEELKTLIDNGIIFKTAYVFFEKEAKKATIWNGNRPEDNITRFEINTILKRLTSSNKDFYNLTNPNVSPTLEEAQIMIKRAINKDLVLENIKRQNLINLLLK